MRNFVNQALGLRRDYKRGSGIMHVHDSGEFMVGHTIHLEKHLSKVNYKDIWFTVTEIIDGVTIGVKLKNGLDKNAKAKDINYILHWK